MRRATGSASLDDTQREEIDAALARVKRARLPLFGFDREDFPLATTADLLAEISDELENGRGAVRLRGLPVERYSDDDIRQIFWGLGRHLGTAVYQNARGEIMGEVRDETRLPTRPTRRSKPARSRHPAPAHAPPARCAGTPTAATSSRCSACATPRPAASASSPAS